MPLLRRLASFAAAALAFCTASASSFAAAGDLLITEIQSDGLDDFWELTNVGTAPIDLSGYKWTDSARTTTGAIVIPDSSSIAAGESVIFTGEAAATFRTQWGLASTVQVFTGAPGLGMNDGITLYNASNQEIFFFSYAKDAFTRSDSSLSAGGHAGISAGGSSGAQSLIWDAASGTTAPRYTFANGTNLGTFTAPGGATNKGSPGYSGFGAAAPTIALALSAEPAAFAESAANPASTGTVTRTGGTTGDLVVSLATSDATEATVPATVTILAGQTSATFPITAVDDTFPDGNKTATLTATAADATAGTATLTVQDDGDVLTAQVMLTEISSSASNPSGEDYWELTNFGGSAVNIAGYSWHDSGRSASAAAAYALPVGSSIGAGESVIFTAMTPAAFRTWWGLASNVQVFQTTGAPGLGQNDGVSFFDESGNELFFFSYAPRVAGPPAAGFTREDGSASLGGHAGSSAGAPTETQNVIWVPSSGTSAPRYTFATGSNYGSFQAATGADFGSPGAAVAGASVAIASASIAEGDSGTATLTLNVTRSDATTAFTVNYAVTGGTATAGTDYATLAAGTLTFTAGGADTLPINLTVNGDTTAESDETVLVTLSDIVNTTGTTTIGTVVGTGTITNDDPITPVFATHPASTTIISGGAATLTVAASGFPTPTIQWYEGDSGVTTKPVGTSSTSSTTFITPALTATTRYWARATNLGGSADSTAATVTVGTGPTELNLANYIRVGRYDLPEPLRTARPEGTPVHNLLGQEASGVAYNWDTDTLFIVGDGGRSVTQVSKTGQLIDTMTLALRDGAPQGTDFYDPEGITYLGDGQFVFTEERDRQLVKFTYAAGTTLARSGAQTVKLGTFDDNTGTEGLTWDPLTGEFIVLKEKSPIGVFQTGVDFAAGTATNGSPTAANSTNLFDTTKLGMTDVADVYALSNLPSMSGQPQASHLLIVGQEDARVVLVDREGNIQSTLNIASDAGNPLNAADQQHEGITMDRAGNIYIVNENGGGSFDFPQLWVYAPSTVPNAAPTAVALTNPLNSIQENTATTAPVKIGDITVTDDGLGTNALSLTGADAASFQITGGALYLKAGVILDFEVKTSYAVTIQVDDTSLGATPDATVDFTLTLTDQAVEAAVAAALIITEVAPWSSGNSPVVAADWFEVTNVSANAVDITGWRVDDSSASFGSALALNGITSIAPGESVIFLESSSSYAPEAVVANFKSVWFGASVPSGLQVGTYQGSGIGLGTGGDAVNLYNSAGVLHSSVTFGSADQTSPYQTFDNTAALNGATVTRLSVVGENGAFAAASSAIEIGSPGYSAPAVLRVTEVAAWSSGNSPVAADWFEVTNFGGRPADITGWKVDDSSESPAAALALGGITSIAPGESVIFIETANLATTRTAFLSNWFGASPPSALQIGNYSGGGIGLSTGGDAVNLFDPANVRRVNVAFGISDDTSPYQTFDNAAGLNIATLATLSAVGTNGAFVAANSANEIGSPGTAPAPAPVFARQPRPQTVAAGATVTFSVALTGAGPFNYQWRKNGDDMSDGGTASGTRTATLTLTGVTTADAAGYYVLVTSGTLANTSDSASLTVEKATQTIAFAGPGTQTTASAPFALEATSSAGLAVAFELVSGPATLAGDTVTLTGTPGTVVVRAIQPGNDSIAAATPVERAFAVESVVVPPVAVEVALSGLNAVYTGAPRAVTVTTVPSVTTSVTYAGSATAPTDAGTYAVVATVTQSGFTGSATGTLTIAPATQTIAFAGPGEQTTASAPIALAATSSAGLTIAFELVSGPATLSGSTLTLTGTAGTVVVRATQAGNANIAAAPAVERSFAVTAATAAPVIATHPASQTVVPGANVTFTVVATGTPAPTYQWRKDGQPITGATAASFSLSGVTSVNAGTYSVVVSNSAGSVTSNGAVLGLIRQSFAGAYFGTLGNGGSFALYVNDDNTGVFLGFAPGSGTAYISRTISVNEDGSFTFTTTTIGSTVTPATGTPTTAALRAAMIDPEAGPQPVPAAAVGDVVFQGTISTTGVLSGASTTGGISMSAALATDTSTESSAGFYQAGASGSASQALIIISPSGQAFVLIQSGDTVDAGTGTVDASGRLTVTTAARQTISGMITNDALAATVTNASGAATNYSGLSNEADPAALDAQRLVNVSGRASAGTGDQVAIGGFVISGTQAKTVLIRAVGPGLRDFGVPTALTAPRLQVHRGSTVIAANTGWGSAANVADIIAAAARSGAFSLTAGSADSVVLTSLQPGAYTAVVSSTTGGSGAVLLEVYELSGEAPAQKLVNLSMRATVGTGDNSLIAGLVIGGTVPKRVLIRAAGPALTPFGVTDALARPQLTLRAANGVLVAQNAGWSTSADATAIAESGARSGAFAFGATSLDAALVLNLAPGSYTAQVTSVTGATGTALVEIYELP